MLLKINLLHSFFGAIQLTKLDFILDYVYSSQKEMYFAADFAAKYYVLQHL